MNETRYCERCAREAFRAWQGWCTSGTEGWNAKSRDRLRLPDLPQLQDARCPECGGSESLVAAQIFYENYHGPWNTGLPNYFVLRIADEARNAEPARRQWGRPYDDVNVGRIPWPEMLRRIQDFDIEQRQARAHAEYMRRNFAGGGRGWDPSFGCGEEPEKVVPDSESVSRQINELATRWAEIVGPELAAVTRPVEFTGRKKRRLVVLADAGVKPPWGGWSDLSRYLPERRTFTTFRAAINKAIAPLHVDHVQFTTTPFPRRSTGIPE